jgi:hypothetical protein
MAFPPKPYVYSFSPICVLHARPISASTRLFRLYLGNSKSCKFLFSLDRGRIIFGLFNIACSTTYIFLIYLTTLSVSRLYNVYDGMINECGAVTGTGIERGNGSTRRKRTPVPLLPHGLVISCGIGQGI